MIASVDVGYGYTKAAAQDGRTLVFPSVVRAMTGPEPGFGQKLDGYRLSVQGSGGTAESFAVGELALVLGSQRTWETRAASRADYATLVLCALRLLGATGGVDLAVGLPMRFFLNREEREALASRLGGLGAMVAVDDLPSAAVRVERVRVFPQGAAAYTAAVGAEPALVRQMVGLVDVGYRTTDYLVMVPKGEGAIPDRELLGSVQIGVGSAYEAVARTLGQDRQVLLRAVDVERAAVTRKPLVVWGEEAAVGDALAREFGRIGDEVVSHLQRVWEDVLPAMGALLVCGGGGQALYSQLARLSPSARVVAAPVTANAAGYASLMAARLQTG